MSWILKRVVSVGVVVLLALGMGTPSATAQEFPALNVRMLSHLPLNVFQSNSFSANDCWGYVSPSGREYALLGLFGSTAVVEITNPSLPVIIGQVPHDVSTWSDIKTFDHYAYVVNETGGGLQVIDLGQVDDGIITLVNVVTDGGLTDVHNIAIDTDSGFLYLCIPNNNGGRLVAYDLFDPTTPVLAGLMDAIDGGNRLHDAQVVTFTEGPYAGRQICFGAGEGRGLDIIDVTDKGNMFLISRTVYSHVGYTHQCWLSADRQLLYINDETDELNFPEVSTTRTIVMDVSNLDSPVFLGTFSSGLPAIDHNLYVHNGLIFEANYQSGLQIFDARTDPVSPTRIGFFDTVPATDAAGFGGAWSVYPFFPSGSIIVSDTTSGLFVLQIDDCNGNGVADADEINANPRIDCNLDGIIDACQIADGDLADVDGDGVPDICLDCNSNGLFDLYEISIGFSPDCNQNSIPDNCEADCNDNGIPDECDIAFFRFESGLLFPVQGGVVHTIVIPDIPEALGDLEFTFKVSALLGNLPGSNTPRYIDFRFNGFPIKRLWENDGTNCPSIPDVFIFNYGRDFFNILRSFGSNGEGLFELFAASSVTGGSCDLASFISMNLTYAADTGSDLNGNGVPDECDPPICGGLEATVWVNADGFVVGGAFDGLPYFGILVGTQGDDVIVGTDGRDILIGLKGDDVICGGDGDDLINGNQGNDIIDGGPGSDMLHGNGGEDTCNNGESTSGCEAGNSARVKPAPVRRTVVRGGGRSR